MSIHFNNEAATVVFYTFMFVIAICVIWCVITMEGARYRRKNRVAIRDAAVEYKREMDEKKTRIRKAKRLEHIEKRQAKKKAARGGNK